MLERNLPLRKRIREVAAPLAYWPRTLRLIWRAAPRLTSVWVLLLAAQGLIPAVPVYLSKPLIDGIVAAIQAGGTWDSLRPLLLPAAALIAALVLIEVLQIAIEWVRAGQAEHVHDYVRELIHAKSIAVDLAFYESPEYYDRLDRARSEAGSRSLALLESGGSLLQSGITLLTMAALLLPFGLWLPLAMLVGTLPALFVVIHFNRRHHDWWTATTPERRWTQYFDSVLTNGAVAAELRLFNLGDHFRHAYRSLRRRLRTEHLSLLRRQSMARLASSTVTLAVTGLTFGWMALRTLQGQLTLGELALLIQAFQRGEGLMRTMLGSAGQIYNSSLFLSNLFAYISIEPTITDPPEPHPVSSKLRKGICFHNVTFRYPGSQRVALDHFSLTIPAGTVAAIVGANGAGKSTLIKLLCRFYDPETGRVELDGVDLRDLRLEQVRRAISVLFQFPVNYQASVSQSIALGDIHSVHPAEAIEAAARGAGAHEFISRLPAGYATLLGRHFTDGTDLSGGEWQRIAMARAFLRQSSILVLDEPTSFMDSWAEAEWFERFRALAEGRTAMIITHRFTIAMRADIIHVMDAGRIVESGTHHELLARGGLYAQSWQAQMQAADAGTERSLFVER